MSVDPTAVTPSSSPFDPYNEPVQPLGRPAAFGCLAGTVPTKPSFSPPTFYTTMVSVHSVILKNAKPGNIPFFGDSITQQLNVADVTPFGLNFGISGNVSEGILYNLDQYYQALNYSRAVSVMIGTNSLRTVSPVLATVEDYIMRILNWLTGPLIWNKILYTGSPQPDYNSNILAVNNYIAGQLSGRPNCQIIDLNPIVAAGGSLSATYSHDGLHLNGAGNDVWAGLLKTALNAL